VERGAITSASITMPCPWILEIIAYDGEELSAITGSHVGATAIFASSPTRRSPG